MAKEKRLIPIYRGVSADYRRFRKMFDATLNQYAASPNGQNLFSMLAQMANAFDADSLRKKGKFEIADAMSNYRRKHRLSQLDLAEKLGCSRRQIVRWEKGAAYPHVTQLRKLKEAGVY